jgi:hypothetical protein
VLGARCGLWDSYAHRTILKPVDCRGPVPDGGAPIQLTAFGRSQSLRACQELPVTRLIRVPQQLLRSSFVLSIALHTFLEMILVHLLSSAAMPL